MRKEEVIDHFNGNVIPYPLKESKYKYDFHFRKPGGTWRYLNSCDDLNKFNGQISDTIMHGGEFRIIDPSTMEVINTNSQPGVVT